MAKFGETLRVLRIKRGYSQAQLANLTGLKRSAISNYEQCIREPDLDTVELFADFFDVSVADLLGRDERDYNRRLHENISSIEHYDKYDDADKLLHENHSEIMQIRESIRRNPELREIYSLTSKATPDKMRQIRDFVRFVTKGDDDDDTNTP
jgi:transcriptional regulator with XRE-family HTH domain